MPISTTWKGAVGAVFCLGGNRREKSCFFTGSMAISYSAIPVFIACAKISSWSSNKKESG